MNNSYRPGIFWTWQDSQLEDEAALATALADIHSRGFGKVLVQPRGCRYSVDDEVFIAAVRAASAMSRERGMELWLHLDPRSLARTLIQATGESAEYLIVAGTGGPPEGTSPGARWLDAETALTASGAFRLRLDYPRTRPYHVHSDGAIAFRPLRLERCLAYRRNANGQVEVSSVSDITGHAHLFVNELTGYVEVFGDWQPPAADSRDDRWNVLAFVAFGSNYPDFAGDETRAYLGEVLESYATAGVALDGLWWDEPGYCTGFDRSFKADRGRLPWGASLAAIHRRLTGRQPVDDAIYLLAETDDGLAGTRREDYYRTIEAAIVGAQADLHAMASERLGKGVRLGVHQTWHQNADDVINGSMDWWRGAQVLGAGFSDVGDAEQIENERQMSEVTAMISLAVSLGRRTSSQEAFCNLWGVRYGEGETVPGEILDWWVDLQATVGCNWLAHTYGPTGYFERPSVWGPGYPEHSTWSLMPAATARLSKALELAEGRLPHADVAVVYPLGAMYRFGSERGNALATDTHDLIAAMLRAGFEVDVVSPESLRTQPVDKYRTVLYLHPFGAKADDLHDLEERLQAGVTVAAAGLRALTGFGYAGPVEWEEQLGPLSGSVETGQDANQGGIVIDSVLMQLRPHLAWRIPPGSLVTRTHLADGGLLVRMCPARFGKPFEGRVEAEEFDLEIGSCRGLFCLRLDAAGEVSHFIAPEQIEWRLRLNTDPLSGDRA
ncbi:MAG TPA: hypothetical protein VFD39_04400 [Trueperaceae bacterium]|nr:hypothetical protein [Trueperaceae bacterium]